VDVSASVVGNSFGSGGALTIISAAAEQQLQNQRLKQLSTPKQPTAIGTKPKEGQKVEDKTREDKRVETEKKDLEEMLERDRQARQDRQEQLENERLEKEQKKWRDWTIDGQIVRAKFVKYIGGVVYLELEDGQQIKHANVTPQEKRWMESGPWK
jgi:hypothetical protein